MPAIGFLAEAQVHLAWSTHCICSWFRMFLLQRLFFPAKMEKSPTAGLPPRVFCPRRQKQMFGTMPRIFHGKTGLWSRNKTGKLVWRRPAFEGSSAGAEEALTDFEAYFQAACMQWLCLQQEGAVQLDGEQRVVVKLSR